MSKYMTTLKEQVATWEFGATRKEQLWDQLLYGIRSKDLNTKLLSDAYGEELKQAKVKDIVNNFEPTMGCLEAFQSTV